MDLGVVPSHLSVNPFTMLGLTQVEAVVSITSPRGQYGYSGHVVVPLYPLVVLCDY